MSQAPRAPIDSSTVKEPPTVCPFVSVPEKSNVTVFADIVIGKSARDRRTVTDTQSPIDRNFMLDPLSSETVVFFPRPIPPKLGIKV